MLAQQLALERKRQGLSRAQAASVCNVSTSFIRDAESDPASCSLGRLLQYMTGLGLWIEVARSSGLEPACSSKHAHVLKPDTRAIFGQHAAHALSMTAPKAAALNSSP